IRPLRLLNVRNVPPANNNPAASCPLFGNQKFNQGCFAGAGLADNRNKLTWFNMKADVVHRVYLRRVFFGYAFKNNHSENV
ncbi:MAG: hypothetical protein UW45_C0022G0001, partial [Parcubacteria group bacterium GW2011_GWC2_44_22]